MPPAGVPPAAAWPANQPANRFMAPPPEGASRPYAERSPAGARGGPAYRDDPQSGLPYPDDAYPGARYAADDSRELGRRPASLSLA